MAKATIHFGMPKTGTSAFQHMLARSETALAIVNAEYPIGFRRSGVNAHHLLAECVGKSDEESVAILDGFFSYLLANSKRNILISSESFTNCFTKRRISGLTGFLKRCRNSHEVAGLMSLRRMDSFLESMYLHSSKAGATRTGPSEYVEIRNVWISDLFEQIGRVRRSDVLDNLNLVKYDASAEYTAALMTAVGLSTPREEPAGNFRNRRLGLKAQSVLLFLERVSEECGVSLPRWPLIKAMESGRFAFPGETLEYTIFPSTQREQIRELSLSAAKRFRVDEYCEFFGAESINEPEYRALSLDNLQPADLVLLRDFDFGRERGRAKRQQEYHGITPDD